MWKKTLCIFSILLLAACLCADQAESEYNSAPGSADGPINFNENLTGSLQSDSDPWYSDYWSFNATAGNSYTFTGEVVNPLALSPMYIGLSVEDSSSTLADETADNGGDTVVLNWTCSSSGTYYLVVYEATQTANGVSTYSVLAEEASGVDDWELY